MRRMSTMKRLLLGAASILLVLTAMRWFSAPRFDDEVLGQLTGRLYYLKRDSEVLNLYTCEADLSGERLIYSHSGHGEDNENLTGFYYDQAEDLVYFTAMRANEWTMFCIDPEGGDPTPLRETEASDRAFFHDNYIKLETGGLKAFNRRGSLYLLENDQERLLRKYSGLYAPDLIPGYYPYGFSPDGEFLVYGHGGRSYIMDLSTGKVSRYVGRSIMQWVPQTPSATFLVPLVLLEPPATESGSLFLRADLVGIPRWKDPFSSMRQWQEQALSPDGSRLLLMLQEPTVVQPRSASIAAYSFTDPQQQPAVLFRAGRYWLQEYNLAMPLGWVSEADCLFVVGYRQLDGPHAGNQGISIRQGKVAMGEAVETGFIPRDYGILRSATFVKDRGKAYLHVSGSASTIWEYDVQDQSLRLVRDNLPPSSALFQPEMSSLGTQFVCGAGGPGRVGVYLIDAVTGEETDLLPAGDTFSFYPLWSPDGNWVSALTAGKKPDAAGTSLDAYDIYPAEGGPAATARSLTVKSPATGATWVARARGKLITWPAWSVDSKRVCFLAGEPREVGIHGPEVPGDSLWSLDVLTGEVTRIADLQAVFTEVGGTVRWVTLVGGTEHGVVFNVLADPVNSDMSGRSVWYAEEGRPPRKISDGEWEVPFGVASCGDKMVGFVRDIRVGGDYLLWAVGADGPEKLVGDILKLACPEGTCGILDLLAWDSGRIFAVAHGMTTVNSTILGFTVGGK